eukprot:GEMP01011483.1.p1 GENE.GEMP01011483.1~~GEMP01011483.1.p1  ORF type:complete len:573 (+),score=148.47 GEMP01011483.1:110-1828(+)
MTNIDKWREINLPNLLVDLSQVSLQIDENQKLGLARKKRLVEDTKEFKACRKEQGRENEEDVQAILKTYQSEIDTINKRAKFAEAAFLKLHRTLHEAPDPSTLVDPYKDEKITTLTAELRDMEDEFKVLKNQDVLVKNLQNKVKELEDQRMREISVEDKGLRFEQMYQESRRFIEQLQAQLLDEKQRFDDFAAAKVMEITALGDEIDKLQMDLDQASQQKYQKVDDGAEEKHALLQSRYDNLSIRLASNEKETTMLRRRNEELERQQQDFAQLLQNAEARAEETRKLLVDKENSNSRLTEELSARPTEEDIQRLKTLLANVEIVDICNVDGATTDLEARLLLKQKELTHYVESQKEEISAERHLVVQLRAQLDVMKTQALGEKTKANKLEERKAQVHPDSLAILGLQPLSAFGTFASEDQATQHMPSMDDIVRAQLELQKEHNRDLEDDRDQWKVACSNERRRADMLHQDNVQLLEKMKYMNSYGRQRDQSFGTDLETRYGDSDEKNPFETFKSVEREKRFQAMSTPERVLVSMGGFLLSIRITRVAMLMYLGTMHFMVCFSFYRLTHSDCA